MSASKSADFISDMERQFEWYAVNAGWDIAGYYLAAFIDHTPLKPDATAQIEKLCAEARHFLGGSDAKPLRKRAPWHTLGSL